MSADIYQPEGGKVLIKSWTKGVEFEAEARKQLEAIAGLPFIYPHIAVMPDVHLGMGATVGSVIPQQGAIIPAAVGVDIGCGMMAMRTFLKASDLPSDLGPIRASIEAAVPAGRTNDGGDGDRGSWGNVPELVTGFWDAQLGNDARALEVFARHSISLRRGPRQLGTLGTGNHFIEICVDEAQSVWVVLHSGSRGVGNKIGSTFIDLAKKDMQRWFINLPNKDLAYLPEGSDHFNDYWMAVTWAQRYARINRQLMMNAVMDVLGHHFPTDKTCRVTGHHANGQVSTVAWFDDIVVNCHHNYVNREQHGGQSVMVTRKGAVRARLGDMGIIPGSMGARSYIVRGLGNADGLHSCSHGAGRRMSRTAATKGVTLAEHEAALDGVECDKSAGTLDETPAAYKDIDAVMEAQTDLVEIVHTLKQVLCVKGISEEGGWKKRRAEKKAKREAANVQGP